MSDEAFEGYWQARLELQLTEPNLSAAQTKRLERQKASWGRAIEQTMASAKEVRAAYRTVIRARNCRILGALHRKMHCDLVGAYGPQAASLILPSQGSLDAREALYFPHAHFNHTQLSTEGDAVIWAPGPTAEAGFRRVADRHSRPRLCAGRVRRGPRGGHFGTDYGPTELGSLASAPNGAARISAEHRQTGSDLLTRIHALPGLRLYRAEQQRLYRGLAGLRLLAGLWLRLSLRRVPRLRIRRRSLPSLRRVPRWRLPRSGGFSRRRQVRPFQPGNWTHGRLRPEIIGQSGRGERRRRAHGAQTAVGLLRQHKRRHSRSRSAVVRSVPTRPAQTSLPSGS